MGHHCDSAFSIFQKSKHGHAPHTQPLATYEDLPDITPKVPEGKKPFQRQRAISFLEARISTVRCGYRSARGQRVKFVMSKAVDKE